ncbi:formyltetrahydrofolate deformylase [Pseudarthrobacter sp. AL07]|uniref:formyltetrahydrofolate deformylase n=1 Tax=unclassified Pseudarthrobacter TaxID=2647000 RepID=UPI00249B7CA8|nr:MULTISPECIES: formyltetrahydrofolate deformylase [unclassified Pseudarthrobacter]MDI3196009.1 formyltetrahydrofolate deformylase [Pseudarthrobacter sp. AL20]MDI3210098.1 formyltetrahydrofolate deformylase [Pseudarthrobacter sp. AL07]
MQEPSSNELILSFQCPDQIGIVHAVTGFLVAKGCNIINSQQFDDASQDRFFMRVQARFPEHESIDALRASFQPTADLYGMKWSMSQASARPKVLIMVSKFDHCLNDLLYRWRSGQLKIDIPLIVSNHGDLAEVAKSQGIPFRHIPVTNDTKAGAEEELLSLVAEHEIDLVVLARYMQVLSDGLCNIMEGRIINIHHSFLPSFRGGKPYHQAFDRGVKLVGATSHYVTADLDEGQIIEQEILRVEHSHTATDLTIAGRDAERVALARAVQWHAEHRILLNGNRTVVFK